MPFIKWPQNLLVAITLLTRYGPAQIVSDSNLAQSRPWFAFVGALLGLFYVSNIYLLNLFLLHSAWVLALIYVTLDMWVTRGLHYDGLADVGDALGSATEGDNFWAIMHDSRLGAFGAMALFVALSAQLIGAQNLINKSQWYALIVAPIFGRILCVLFTNIAPAYNPKSLGGKVCTQKNNPLFYGYILLSMVLMLPLGLKLMLGIHLIGAIFLYFLYKVAHKHRGCNGDMLGTIIIGGQCIVLLAC